jgi:hypothetical protein
MEKDFDARIAAKAIFNIIKKTINIDSKRSPCWLNLNYGKDFAQIALDSNFMFISVTKDGYQLYSRHAMFPVTRKRSKSYKDFKDDMKHISFYCEKKKK